MNLNSILASLPKLGRADLAKVQAAVNHLLAGRVAAGPEQALYGALCGTVGQALPYTRFSLTQAHKQFQQNAPLVMGFVASTWPGASKTETMALTRHLLALLKVDLQARGVEPTLGIMVNNLSRVPEVFDQAYPAYRQSGLAHLVLEAMERNR